MKNLINRLHKLGPKYFAEMKYPQYIDTLPIDDSSILLESQQGRGIDGNIYYIIEELLTDEKYSSYTLYVSADNKSVQAKIKSLISKCHGEARTNIVATGHKPYLRALATCKYLFNDNTFLTYFIKRDEQVYINVGHGTPFKNLGRYDKANCHTIGNVQKNYFFVDYFLCPNEFTARCQREDYMIDNLSKARFLLYGYPRNAVFFDDESRMRIRERHNLEGMRVYGYMPTWRHTTTVPIVEEKEQLTTDFKEFVNAEEQRIRTTPSFSEITNLWLEEIDKSLEDDEILYVKVHLRENDGFNIGDYKHIRMYPSEEETYEFLNACDCLITDYSSVFYDFAVTGRKIVLFTYDEDEYLETRGVHTSIEELLFPRAKDAKELVEELRLPKQYDDTEFLREYCAFENINATRQLLDRVIGFEEPADRPPELICDGVRREYDCPCNGKKNVLVYVGSFAPNGITSSLKGLLSNIDLDRHNYYLNFQGTALNMYKSELGKLPKEVRYISRVGKMSLNLRQNIVMRLYAHKLTGFKHFWKVMKPAYEKDIVRQLAHNKFDAAIQYTGYEYKKIMMYSLLDAQKIIYVHSDMIREAKVRRNQRLEVLRHAYQNYDRVITVTEDIIQPTEQIAEGKCNVSTIANLINVDSVIEASDKPVTFNRFTVSNVTIEKFKHILEEPGPKFINLGRYSPEKGHDRLVRAFDRYRHENPNAYLIIVGGNQMKNGYRDLEKICKRLESNSHIIRIKGGCSPYPVVKQCDGLILSSYYEGFGLVLAEADMIGVPSVSVDIDGPRGFMKDHGGLLVENSEDGLLEAMRLIADGRAPLLNADYRAVNRMSSSKFEELI